jgi:hypothetical protein
VAHGLGEPPERGGVEPPSLPVERHVDVVAAGQAHQPPVLQVGQELRLRDHGPAQAAPHRFVLTMLGIALMLAAG